MNTVNSDTLLFLYSVFRLLNRKYVISDSAHIQNVQPFMANLHFCNLKNFKTFLVIYVLKGDFKCNLKLVLWLLIYVPDSTESELFSRFKKLHLIPTGARCVNCILS